MRIAVVGKWGSGKTTISALLALYLAQQGKNLLLIDADLNVHLPGLFLPWGEFPEQKYLSFPETTQTIKTYLKGDNQRIGSLETFRKTTPPTSESQLFVLRDRAHPLYCFAEVLDQLALMVVGTYQGSEIGASCYHNHLAILENLLSHMDDQKAVVVVDMVAGVDAFASSLHAQFDLLLLVLEPTQKGKEVWKQYARLAQAAGVYDQLFALGNKCFDQEDQLFLSAALPSEKLLGMLGISSYLRQLEKQGGLMEFSQLEPEFQLLFEQIVKQAQTLEQPLQARLDKLYALHRKYVAQGFIKERFGDLPGQIDEHFSFL